IAACDLERAAIGDAETADLRTDQREVLRLQTPQAMATRHRIRLLIAERTVDLGQDLVVDGEKVGRRLHGTAARAAALLRAPALAGRTVAAGRRAEESTVSMHSPLSSRQAG